MRVLGQIAELRRAPSTTEFFVNLAPADQVQWTQDLLHRTQFEGPERVVPYVCVLDTGVAQGHPLLEPALLSADMHSVEPHWLSTDLDGHGTGQAALALWGDLDVLMGHALPVSLGHRLESVKILNANGGNVGGNFGLLTQQAVARPEISNPNRTRVFSMAVSSPDTGLVGRATAWSAAVDGLASDWSGDGELPRLFVLAAGNVDENGGDYPALNGRTSIEDPGSSLERADSRRHYS